MISVEDVASLVGEDLSISFMTKAGQKSVFRATSPSEDLVIKFVAIEERDEDGEIMPLSGHEERLRREIRLMSAVESAYLPRLGSIQLSEHTFDGLKYLYFSEKYIGDKNVKVLIDEDAFTPIRLKQLAYDVTTALITYSNFENGFVHRDIKPANIVLSDTTDKFILIDGGIHLLPSNPTITFSSDFVGTRKYASPEQTFYGRRSLDSRSDIFSLGVVLYEIAENKHPFFSRGTDPQEALKNLAIAKYTPIQRQGYEQFMTLINKMLTQYQHSRYSSPEDLLKDIEGLQL